VPRRGVRKEQIVDAAVELFGRHGFRGTSVAAVAQAVGVTDAGVLYHFHTKDDLLIAVVERLTQGHWDEMDVGLSLGGLHAIRTLGLWGAWMEQRREYQALLVVLSAEHLQDESAVNAYFAKRYRLLVDRLAKAFDDAAAAGDLRADVDGEVEASLYVAMLDGLRLQWFMLGDRVPLGELCSHYVDNMVERLSP